MADRDDIVTGVGATAGYIDAQLAAGTGDQHPHLEPRSGLQRLPPLTVGAVPFDRRRQPVVEVVLRLPTQRRNLVVGDGVATIVTEAIGHGLDEALIATRQ